MKIALVALPNPILATPDAHFPQGLLYVGGALKRAGHEVQVQDLRTRQAILGRDIPDVDLVAITATSGEVDWAHRVASKARDRGLRVMIGGPHGTFVPNSLPHNLFDYIIKGDGELAAVEALAKGPGVYQHPLEKLDGIFPDWDLIGERGFSRELFTGEGYGQGPLCAGLSASRGCTYHCSYCRSERDKVRYRPLEDVAKEIRGLQARGVNHLRFYDESLTLNKKRALELFDLLRQAGVHWRAHTRSDTWDDEVAATAKASGCDEMGFGFEAASDHVLAKIRKQETVAQHREAVRVCKRAGITCKAFWMVGLPRQGWREVSDILEFMHQERPDKWIVSLFAPYPGSDVWAHPETYGVTWCDPHLEHYWNFPEAATLEYHDNPREEIWSQYEWLKTLLEREFPKR